MKIELEDYYNRFPQQKEALLMLRSFIRECGLQETVKWGAPMFTHSGNNVVGLAAFKSYVGLWFIKGALMEDAQKKLINAQEGKTQMNRQWRFESTDEIKAQRHWVVDYCLEAKKLSEVKHERNIKPKTMPNPPEWEEAIKNKPELKTAFSEFSPYKQREFLEYIAEAKRVETRLNRLEKCIDLIKQGIGLNDKYRK